MTWLLHEFLAWENLYEKKIVDYDCINNFNIINKRDVWKTYAYQFLKKNIGSQEATVQDLAM